MCIGKRSGEEALMSCYVCGLDYDSGSFRSPLVRSMYAPSRLG
jgi:hypothetical protein